MTEPPTTETGTVAVDAKAAPERYFTFLGLTIVRKADVLAATAFLLAGASTTYQLGNYLFGGAHLSIFAPENVYIFFDTYSNGQRVTRFAGQITFTNGGQQGRNGTVREASLELIGPEFFMRQYWVSFPKITRDVELLKIEAVDSAYPFQVAGEGTVSKMTGFAPRLEPCGGITGCDTEREFVSDTDFLKRLSPHLGESITVTFKGRTFQSGEIRESRCRIYITEELLTYLGANDWYLVRCAPENATVL